MDVMMNPQDEIRSPFNFSFWVSRNRSVLALQAASVFLFFFTLLSLRVDLSALSISSFTFNLGRTHMFILCNGIVAILVKGSALADPLEGEAEMKKAKNVEETHKINDDVSEEKSVETVVGIVVVEEEEEKDQEATSGCVLIAETMQIDQQLVEEEQEEEERKEEDGFEELSLEELNKKCDEFIKRMRGHISNEHTQTSKFQV